MKLLFLTVNLGGGGAEKVLVNLANQLAERGHQVTVRSLVDVGVNRRFLSQAVQYESVLKKSVKGLGILHKLPHRWIYRKVCHGDYDVIIPYMHGTLTRIVSYGPATQKKVAWLHADMEKSPFMRQLVKEGKAQQCFSAYDKVIAVADSVKVSFEKVTAITDKCITLYNTFDISGICEKAKEASQEPHTAIRLVSVGKLEPVKGYDRLLRAFRRLREEDSLNLELTIVGEGVERDKLEKYLAEHSLQERVSLPGFDANPYRHIAGSDLFVCSSFSEGFSSVIAESLILGVPVVTTECSGMREMLGNQEYGIITENSEDGLYEGIKVALSQLDHWRAQARIRSSFFSVEETVGAVEKMLKGVMEEQ